jgi:hypothetical protein
MNACVYRDVRGESRLIPVEDAVELRRDEKVFVGEFTYHDVTDGPSRSHTRTVATPAGKVTEVTPVGCMCGVPQNLAAMIQAKLRH